MARSSPSVLLASFCIHAGWSLNFSVPCVPTGTPQGYATLSPHPHPRMRMLPLVSVRGTFGWAYLWSTLLASFLVRGGSTVLDNIAHCSNILICILQLVKGYFSSQYYFITHLDGSWTSKVQDYPHFFSEMGSLVLHCSVLCSQHQVLFDYLATNLYGCMGSIVDHQSTTDACQLQCNRLFQGKCLDAHGSHKFQG